MISVLEPSLDCMVIWSADADSTQSDRSKYQSRWCNHCPDGLRRLYSLALIPTIFPVFWYGYAMAPFQALPVPFSFCSLRYFWQFILSCLFLTYSGTYCVTRFVLTFSAIVFTVLLLHWHYFPAALMPFSMYCSFCYVHSTSKRRLIVSFWLYILYFGICYTVRFACCIIFLCSNNLISTVLS